MIDWHSNFNSTEELMTVAAHLDELKKKHHALSMKVEEEQRAPGSNDLEIAALKKKKLKLKEEISRLTG